MILVIHTRTRSYVALRAADLDWIVGPGYSSGWYILGCSQRLASCLWHSARIEITSTAFLLLFLFLVLLLLSRHPGQSPHSPWSVLLFAYFFVLFQYFFRTLSYFFITFSVIFPFFTLFFAKLKIYFQKIKNLKKKFAGTCNL